ncbi:hypothetical protein [Ruegeria sp.]|uniref:hypothetical protein n=1 Tax=Ruegeria sp. TaxID=1879320 RepID=UPI002325D26D|nr:hypothetical protein [Ruegeria sp.]MDA7963645.1 hypothetical protein [Ruegeria sp.]
MRAGIYLYPWDLKDAGASALVARLGDAGISAIHLATSYHAGKFLRPHGSSGKVYFPQDGTVYFHPDPSLYGRIKPRVADLIKDFDPLSVLAKTAPDLERIAWTVGLHNTPLGQQHPDLTARTVFGDPLFNSLCASQPDVRNFLTALCCDIARNQPVAEVSVETPGWQAFRHGHHHEFELIELTASTETLLGLCFCDACKLGATSCGIGFDALKTMAADALERFFADGTEPGFDPLADPEWRAFHTWRAEQVTSLVRRIRSEMPRDVRLSIIPTTQSPNALCLTEGSDLAALSRVADALEIPSYQNGVSAMTDDIVKTRELVRGSDNLGYILRPSYPNLTDASQVRAAVQMLKGQGAKSISFYNYGHMRLQSLDWIRAALT